MSRRWTSFNPDITNREFAELPQRDRSDLFEAMKAYRMELTGGYTVSNYGEGLLMIKAANHTQGRCLFFSIHVENGVEVLTALLAYKKETQKAEKQQIATARMRMRRVRGQ